MPYATRSATRAAGKRRLSADLLGMQGEQRVTQSTSTAGQGEQNDDDDEFESEQPALQGNATVPPSRSGTTTVQRFQTPTPGQPFDAGSVIRTPAKKLQRSPDRIGGHGINFWGHPGESTSGIQQYEIEAEGTLTPEALMLAVEKNIERRSEEPDDERLRVEEEWKRENKIFLVQLRKLKLQKKENMRMWERIENPLGRLYTHSEGDEQSMTFDDGTPQPLSLVPTLVLDPQTGEPLGSQSLYTRVDADDQTVAMDYEAPQPRALGLVPTLVLDRETGEPLPTRSFNGAENSYDSWYGFDQRNAAPNHYTPKALARIPTERFWAE